MMRGRVRQIPDDRKGSEPSLRRAKALYPGMGTGMKFVPARDIASRS